MSNEEKDEGKEMSDEEEDEGKEMSNEEKDEGNGMPNEMSHGGIEAETKSIPFHFCFSSPCTLQSNGEEM